ncbi:Protein transport protein Sec24C [Thelohanellus kitauei]|uniref:Protein transport protein Sec24C n=1 Tax=Thelohanellus kitauei TaxID=669202 RepID=A0A0C2MFX6_THEKT|nr:Protein transport protein Sec24C [Thelohanellus kitauei]
MRTAPPRQPLQPPMNRPFAPPPYHPGHPLDHDTQRLMQAQASRPSIITQHVTAHGPAMPPNQINPQYGAVQPQPSYNSMTQNSNYDPQSYQTNVYQGASSYGSSLDPMIANNHQPGYSSQPNFSNYPGYGSYSYDSSKGPTYQEEKKKNASDTMPHPIMVNYKEYEKYFGQTFDTSSIETMPPQISTTNVYYTNFKNTSPEFMRSTLYGIPNTSDLLKNSNIPMGVIVTPFANNAEFPTVDHGSEGPIRCRRCRAYVNPYIQFVNGGKNFRCNICSCVNDVPDSYFCNLDQSGTRLDYADRPELIYGTYNYETTASYCRNNKLKAPFIIFLIDVTYTAISSGMVQQVTTTLSSMISQGFFNNFQGDNGVKIGFIAYDTRMYVFCPKNDAEMEVVFDLEEPFVSSLSTFVVDPVQYKDALLTLLEKIPVIFEHNKQVDVILGPVVKAVLETVQSQNTACKLFVFHANLPNFEVQGQLKYVEDRTQLGSEDEKKILAPQSTYYSDLGDKCVEFGVGVDLYLFPTGPVEVASLAPLCTKTGGRLKLYKYYKSGTNGNLLSHDIEQNLTSFTGLDTMAKLRCSNGISIKNIYGNCTTVNVSEVIMSTVDSTKSITFELVHDEKVSGVVYLQFAILFTTYGGKRLIRVINLCLKVVDNLVDVFKLVDCDALSHYFLKYTCKYFLDNGISVTKQHLISLLVKILVTYRKNCASASSPLQLVLPENIKLLPLYLNTILNSDCISGGKELVPDDKSYALFSALSANLNDTNIMFYSRVFDILTMIEGTRDPDPAFEGFSCEYFVPNGIIQVRCSYERLNSSRVYLLENGVNMFLWFGKQVNPTVYQDMFGVANDQHVGTMMDHLPAINSELSKQLASLVSQIRRHRQHYMRVSLEST